MSGSRERRRPRPTIKFLRMLPSDSFPDEAQAKAIAEGKFKDLAIGEVRHPLIEDAVRQFQAGRPDLHKSSTAVAGESVFEVRSRTGAAWRGAVILDKDGDPWLVWASKHDEFHHRASSVLKGGGLDHLRPAPVEYKLRAREDADAQHRAWRVDATAGLFAALAEAVELGRERCRFTLPEGSDGTDDVDITLDHDMPADALEDSGSLLTLVLRTNSRMTDDFVAFIVPNLQANAELIDPVYGPNGTLELWVTVTHAQLAQIVASRGLAIPASGDACIAPPTALHYVATKFLADGYVRGVATRGICGIWFVPTRDDHAKLPVCSACEDVEPSARRTTELLTKAFLRG